MPFRHPVRVRYGDCDMQGVVFNANYLAYVDDAVDAWFATVLGPTYTESFDFMLKKATVEWSSPARYRDQLDLDVSASRWGTTSFDVTVEGSVGGRPAFTATIVYVAVDREAHTPVPVPDDLRAALAA